MGGPEEVEDAAAFWMICSGWKKCGRQGSCISLDTGWLNLSEELDTVSSRERSDVLFVEPDCGFIVVLNF